MKIRLAQMADITELNRLIALSARQLSKNEYSMQEIESAIQYVFGVDTELLLDKTYYVIHKGAKIIGCGGWSKRATLFGGNQFLGRNKAEYLNAQTDAAKIRAFFIHPQYARQGLGHMLLIHCEHEAQKQGFHTLEMMATLPGVKLYQTSNYKPMAEEVVTLPDQVKLKFIRMMKIL